MSVKKSDIITSMEAKPVGFIDGRDNGGSLKVRKAIVEVATTDLDAADVIHMVPMSFDDRIHSIKIFNDDLDSNGTPTLAAHVGLFHAKDGKLADGTAFSAGDVIDADAYAAAIADLQAANTVGVEVAFKARDIAKGMQSVLDDAGLAANKPNCKQVYLGLTISNAAATAAAGTILMVVEFV